MKDFNFSNEQRENLVRINEVIEAVEAKGIDLTDSYDKWLRIGMGIAHDFGEDGRALFHRVSRTYSKYNFEETEKKYDNFLKSKNSGSVATCATLFYYAKQAGIELKGYSLPKDFDAAAAERPLEQDVQNDDDDDEMELIPEWVYGKLPEVIREPVMGFKATPQREMVLLGSLVAFSAVVPMFYGVYDNKRVSPNLYMFAIGEPSSGKGALEFCKKLVNRVHWSELETFDRMNEAFKRAESYYNAHCKKEELEQPKPPKQRLLLMPANTTATALYQHLSENNKGMLIIETEGDTMNQAFKNDKGNYSDGLRKAFHNEEISYARRTDNEFRQCENPRLSVIMSGTPDQVQSMFTSVENGLFSRFMFYNLPNSKEWKDVLTPVSDNSLDEVFNKSGRDFYELYKRLINDRVLYRFFLTESQGKRFNEMFGELKPEFNKLYESDITACIHRAGVMMFRIAMVLTALRSGENGAFNLQEHEENVAETYLDFGGGEIVRSNFVAPEMCRMVSCADNDYEVAEAVMRVVIQHIVRAFQQLPRQVHEFKANYRERYKVWYEKLGEQFSYAEMIKLGKKCNISESSASRRIRKLVDEKHVVKDTKGNYTKISKSYPYVSR